MTKSNSRSRVTSASLLLSLLVAAALTACGGGAVESEVEAQAEAESQNASALARGGIKGRPIEPTPTPEPTPDPIAEPTPEPTPDPAPEPVPTLTPTSSPTPAIATYVAANGYGAAGDQGQTDDPLTDAVTYAGHVYYVDCNAGSDANDGRSPATAWRTAAQVQTKTRVGYWDTVAANSNTTPPYHTPWTAAPSGSAFLFKRGCMFDGFISVHAATFTGSVITYSQNFTFGAYGSRSLARPVIKYITPSTQFRGMFWSNGHQVQIRNLHFTGNPSIVSAGISLRGVKNSSFVNSVIEDVYGDGIGADDTENFLVQNSSVLRTQAGGGRGGGLAGSGTNLRVLHSTFVDNGRDKVGAHNIYVRHLHGAVFEGNALSGGSNLGIVIHGKSENVQIRYNDIFGNSNGIDVTGGYLSEAEVFDNITIENNRIRDNGYRVGDQGYGLLLKSMVNSTIRNNLVYGNRLGTLNMADANSGDIAASNVKIFQNLFHDPGTGSGVVFNGAGLAGIDMRNNILVQLSATRTLFSKSALVPEAALTMNNNLYYAPANTTGKIFTYNATAITLGQLLSMTGKEAAGRYGDPLFISDDASDYRVQLSSPARNLGAPVDVAVDFAGQARSTTSPTTGAHE